MQEKWWYRGENENSNTKKRAKIMRNKKEKIEDNMRNSVDSVVTKVKRESNERSRREIRKRKLVRK